MYYTCPSCNIDVTEGVKCSKCSKCYCYSCANITEKNYRKLGTHRQACLLCAACKKESSPAASPGPPTATLEMVLHELRQGIVGINARLEPLPALIDDVRDIKLQMAGYETALANVRGDVAANQLKTDNLGSRVDALEATCKDDGNYPHLREQLNKITTDLLSREQRERLNNVEIKGIPQKKNENLLTLVGKLGQLIGQNIVPGNVNFITRARSDAKTKPIIVGFTGRIIKENFVAAAKSHKNLTAEDMGFQEDSSKIFINDHLTRDNKQLLTKTKNIASEKGYRFVWVQNCKILVRKNDTSPFIHIQCDEDLAKLK